MVTLTDKAKEKARFYMTGKDAKAWGIRIRAQGNKFEFSLEETHAVPPVDAIHDVDGVKVIVDKGTEIRLVGATIDFVETPFSSGFKVDLKTPVPTAPSGPSPTDPLARKVQDILNREINPALAGHGGMVRLVDVKDNVVSLKFGGGCHGCGMVDMTLRQGIETRLKEAIPEIVEVVDTTDHAVGENPYYSH